MITVSGSPSGSVPVRLNVTGVSSSVTMDAGVAEGASLTGLTKICAPPSADRCSPSSTRYRTMSVPL